jgi:hypothetical protein
MCAKSRAVTAPEQMGKMVTPVRVQGLERVWSKRSISGMTAMGVQFREKAECAGICIPVSRDELDHFDQREVGYTRVPLSPEVVRLFQDTNDESSSNSEQNNIFRIKNQNTDSSFYSEEVFRSRSSQLWVYLPTKPCAASEEYPIAQTYMDIIIRGCLSISESFLVDFLEKTTGYYPHTVHASDNLYDSIPPDNQPSMVPIVNDRHNPIYVRGDKKYSREYSGYIDSLIRKYKPEILMSRRLRFTLS